MNPKSIIRWIFEPARFFLLVSVPLTLVYCSDLMNLTRYNHGPQRLLYAVSIAQDMIADGGRIPVSFLELVYRAAPRRIFTVADNACRWSKPLQEAYCKRPVQQPENVTFSALREIPLDPDRTFEFVPAMDAAHFPVFGYWLYAAGALFGLLLHASPIVVMYLAIGVNAAVTIALSYLAIRMSPALRWPFCYLLLMPTLFHNRAYIMPDALNLTLIVLMFVVALRLWVAPRLLDGWDKLAMAMLAIFTAAMKIAYALTPLVYCVIPACCFKNVRAKYATLAAILLASSIFTFCIMLQITETYYRFSPLTENIAHSTPVNSRLEHILNSPIPYISDSLSQIVANARWHAVHFFIWGGGKHWMMAFMNPLWFFIPLFLWPLFEPLLPYSGRRQEWAIRGFNLAIFAATAILTFTLIYLHSGNLKGLQGRHFIPALPFLLLSLHSAIPRFRAIRHRVAPVLAAYTVGCVLFLNFMQLR